MSNVLVDSMRFMLVFLFGNLFIMAGFGLISLLSGWYFISRKYPARRCSSDLNPFNLVSIGLGSSVFPFRGVPASHSAFVQVNEQGIAVSTWMPFRFLSPPIFIPWKAVESCEEIKVFFRICARVRLKTPKRQFLFYDELGREILNTWISQTP
jgi:hypothetical protein